MAGFIDAAVQDIDNRLKELKEEEQKLLAAAQRCRRCPPARSRPPARADAGAAPTRRSRAAVPAARAAAAAVTPAPTRRWSWSQTSPASRSREIAEALKIEPNYLYRVMPKLDQLTVWSTVTARAGTRPATAAE